MPKHDHPRKNLPFGSAKEARDNPRLIAKLAIERLDDERDFREEFERLRQKAEASNGLRRRRRPPEGGEPIPDVPPRGPVPLAGGAEAPIE